MKNSFVPASTLQIILLIIFCFVASCSDSEKVNIPKGVVLVLVDDIGYGDIDILYPGDLNTPEIDRLYQESVRLTDFHVGTTCSPTRASLMTGRNINVTGVWHTIAGRDVLRENEQTMAEVFKANGWGTGHFGKWHLGDGYPYYPRYRGFDVTYIHGGGGISQQPDYYGNNYYAELDNSGNKTTTDVYFHNGKEIVADEFCTDYWFSRAKEFIGQSLKEGKPFFCYIPLNAAHWPFNAPNGYKAGFDGLIENIDYNMGQLDEFLEDKGVMQDVLLIFTTDNGTTGKRLGGLRERKGSNYDGGHNVPCFWRWENSGIGGAISLSRDMPSLSVAADLLPTFIDMFKLEKPVGGMPLDGISLKDHLLDPDHKPQDRVWIIDTQRGADLEKWKRASVLKDQTEDGEIIHKWRLLRRTIDDEPELYDFFTDRAQEDNIIEGEEQLVSNLEESYNNWWSEISADWKPYTPFVLGVVKENTLFSHNWIGENTAPWNQNQVRNAAEGSRTSSVRFDSSGTYAIELRRWPREDGGAIDGPDSNGEGVALSKAVKASLEIAGTGVWTKAIEPGSIKVIFEADVIAGDPTTLTTAFMDEDGNMLCGAYYVYIRKMIE